MSKPPSSAVLDTGNALYANLKAFWALLEGSGTTSADKTGNGFTLTLDSSVTWSTDGAGDLCIAEATATKPVASIATGFTFANTADWSVAFRAKQTASGTSGMIFGNTANPNFVWVDGGSNLQIRDNASANQFFSGETVFTADHDYVITYDHTGNQYHLFIDGVEAGDSPRAAFNGSFDVKNLGTAYSGNSFSLVGTLTYCYAWSARKLTGAEATTLHNSPYGMLAVPATAYTTSLSSSFGTTGDAVTVTFTPNGITTGTITPTTDSTGVFSPTSLTWSGTGGAKTCTYTPSVVGVHHINSTNTASLANTSGAQTYNSTTEGVLSITSPTQYQGYQVTGSNINVTVSGTYTHSATGDGVVDVSIDGSTWATLCTASGGTFSGTLVIPSTANTNFTLTVRWHTDTISTATVPNQILGDVFIWGGDSNSSGRGINNQNFTGTTASVYPTSGGWKIANDEVNASQTSFPSGTEGNILPLIISELNAWNTANGSPGRGISVITCGLSSCDCFGTTNEWTPGHSAYTPLVGTQVPASGVNGILGVIWSNGPNASLSIATSPAMTGANYKAAVETMLNGFVTDIGTTYGVGGHLPAVILSMGKMSTSAYVTTRATINAARAGSMLAVNDGLPAAAAVNTYDVALTDGVHWTQNSEMATVAARYAVAIINEWYGGPYGRGPVMTSVTLDATKTIVTISFNRLLAAAGGGYTTGAFRVLDNSLSGAITGATNASPIVITSANHGLNTGATVVIAGVGGNTGANATWDVTKIDANTFSLVNSTGSGAYTSGGTWTGGNPVSVSTAVQTAGKVVLTLAAPTSSLANTQVSLGSGNDALGATVPTAIAITLPSGSVVAQPAEPFFDVVPTAASTPGGGGGIRGRIPGRMRRLRRV